MFRVDGGFFHPLIPYLPSGHAIALFPIIPSPVPSEVLTPPMRPEESDEFRMYEFKVRKCPVSRAHDWTVCPWAHPGERARRRDPRRVAYKAVPCEEYRTSQRCGRGDLCEYAHGVFEYWLHPSRYRTRACTSGAACKRKVCFFAHAPQELRAETRYPLGPQPDDVTTPIISSSSSNRVDCGGDDEYDEEMPHVEWIRDLIG